MVANISGKICTVKGPMIKTIQDFNLMLVSLMLRRTLLLNMKIVSIFQILFPPLPIYKDIPKNPNTYYLITVLYLSYCKQCFPKLFL